MQLTKSFAAALLATVAFAPAAHAIVVQTPTTNIAVPNTGFGVKVNLQTGETDTSAFVNQPMGWDLEVWGDGYIVLYTPNPVTGGFVQDGPQALSLDIGDTVGASTVSDVYYGAQTTFGSAPGQWRLNDTNYFGFRFLDQATGLTHFAWGTLIVGATPAERTIGALFYESEANVAIAVGAMPVPEASTLAMMLAGGGLLAGVAKRRRRV